MNVVNVKHSFSLLMFHAWIFSLHYVCVTYCDSLATAMEIGM